MYVRYRSRVTPIRLMYRLSFESMHASIVSRAIQHSVLGVHVGFQMEGAYLSFLWISSEGHGWQRICMESVLRECHQASFPQRLLLRGNAQVIGVHETPCFWMNWWSFV